MQVMTESICTVWWNDPERPCDTYYYDLDYVPGYAQMPTKRRIDYLDWMIIERRNQNKEWREEYAKTHDKPGGLKISQFVSGKFSHMVRELEVQRHLELASLEPILKSWQCDTLNGRKTYRDSSRRKRKSDLKMVAVVSVPRLHTRRQGLSPPPLRHQGFRGEL